MKLTAIILALFAVVTTVNAATNTDMEQHEVLFNATTGGLKVGGGASGASSPLTIGATFGYNYQFMPGFMVGIEPSIAYTNNQPNTTTSNTSISFLAGPTVNFPFTDKFDDAFYLFGGVGMVYNSAGTVTITNGNATTASSTNFEFGFELGKRFQLFEHVIYRPSISYTKVTSAGLNGTFAFNVLSFAAAF
jgi:hypothetical protein